MMNFLSQSPVLILTGLFNLIFSCFYSIRGLILIYMYSRTIFLIILNFCISICLLVFINFSSIEFLFQHYLILVLGYLLLNIEIFFLGLFILELAGIGLSLFFFQLIFLD